MLKLAEAEEQLMRAARYDWVESYVKNEFGALTMIAEDADRMVRECIEKLDELREG